MRRAVLLAIAVAALLPVRDAGIRAQAQADALTFFKNYFVTGDYVTAGVGMRGKGVDGLATDVITVNGVPPGADIVAAFLYWQVVTTTGADTGSVGVRFRGYDLSLDNPATPAFDPEPFGKALAFSGTAPCFNPGGSTGESAAITWTYRADVLRFFATDDTGTAATNPNYGKLAVNGPHQVTLPDSGPNGNNSPMAVGASLVVIYRIPTMPLSAIVLYDDGVTLANEQRTLVQDLAGFYQASAAPAARISYIVGSGQPTKNDYVIVPGAAEAYPNVFAATAGTAWDNLTYDAGVAPNASQVMTTVSNDVSGGGGRDCLTLAAMVFKVGVQDTDNDGLLDIWETVGAPGGPAQLLDPLNQPLPALGAMGASPTRKDVFLEVGYMGVNAQVDSDGNGTPDSVQYGMDLRPPHSHLPGHEALKLVGDAFASAPVDGGQGIALHVDVGPNYPACSVGQPCADPYIIGRRAGESAALARGGEAIDEMATVCTPSPGGPEWECQYSGHPGTVGWKSGYRFLRDQVLSVNGAAPPPGFDEEVCGTLVGGVYQACERRFDANRMSMFRYALFAHGLGLPKSDLPCLDGDGIPVPAGADDRCAAGTTPNPDFHTPRTNTGVGDFFGADMLVTLGAFLDLDNLTPTGTPFMQAATLMHEMGHTMGRRHGGDAFEPNCKPQYFSVMNYTYQLRGLVKSDGLPAIDFSSDAQAGSVLNENSLMDGNSGVNPTTAPYSLAWFAPIAGPLADRPGIKAARRHCDGSLITDGAQYVRVESGTPAAIDWNQNGVFGETVAQDINFDGVSQSGPASLRGTADWSALALNQVASRRNVGGLFVDPVTGALLVGPLSGDVGKGDLGKGDLGKGDLGKGDLGKGDLGKGDLGKGDLGKGDLGKGDLGKGDLGGGDFFGDQGEIDETLANDLIRVPPYAVGACQIGLNCPPEAPAAPQHYVRVNWTAPSVGGIVRYTVYRALQQASGLPGPFAQAGTVNVAAGLTNRTFEWIDPNSHRLVQGRTYHYYVTATYLVRNPDTGVMEELESVNSTPDALVTITNNAPSIAHSIPPQTIPAGGSTNPLSFTVGDLETLASLAAAPNNLTVSATTSSSTPGLAAAMSFTFGPGGPASTSTSRTVIVSHTGALTGTVTVTLSVQDTQCSHASPPVPCTPGTTSAASFTVTVTPPILYRLEGTANVPPAATNTTFNAGRTVPMDWRYVSIATGAVVNSSAVVHRVTVTGPVGAPVTRTYTSTDSGNSSFRYSASSRTWQFNLQTKDAVTGQSFPAGTYDVVITPISPSGYGASPTFQFVLR